MATTLTVRSVDATRRQFKRSYKVAFSGNYPTGGDALDFTSVANTTQNPQGLEPALPGGPFDLGALTASEVRCFVRRAPAGYGAEIVPNLSATSYANAFTLKLFSAAGTELAAAAYPAAITADFATIELEGPKGLI